MARVIVEGIEKLQEKLEKLVDGAREEVVRSLDKSALMVLRSAQQKCPVRTGNLRASLTKEVSKDDLYAVVGTKVHYAPYVEYGTRKMAPRAYLRPAYLENEKSIKEMLKGAVMEAVRKL
jgi:HK97 gp10 family phage protein